MREPLPPRTNPRWRPCARVITSRMAFASPWRRAPSTMPSSVQSIVHSNQHDLIRKPVSTFRDHALTASAALGFLRHHTTRFVVGDKAAIVVRLFLLLLRAGMDRI